MVTAVEGAIDVVDGVATLGGTLLQDVGALVEEVVVGLLSLGDTLPVVGGITTLLRSIIDVHKVGYSAGWSLGLEARVGWAGEGREGVYCSVHS